MSRWLAGRKVQGWEERQAHLPAPGGIQLCTTRYQWEARAHAPEEPRDTCCE